MSKRFSQAELDYILAHPSAKTGQMAKHLGRSRNSINDARARLGVSNPAPKRWTKAERALVLKLLPDHSYKDISLIVGRTVAAIIKDLRRSGKHIKKHNKRPWTKDEKLFLFANAGKITTMQAAAELGRTKDSVENYCKRLKLVWSNGTIPYKTVAAIVGVHEATVARRMRKMHMSGCRIQDEEQIQKLALNILNDNRSINRIVAPIKHIEKVVAGDFDLALSS